MDKFPLSKRKKIKPVVHSENPSYDSAEDFIPTSERVEEVVKGFGGLVCEIDGELREVQGCIERMLDIIESHERKCERKETSATSEYSFFHTEIGEIGKLKISALPKGKTYLHSNFADSPNEEWLVKYLSNLVLLKPLSEPLQALLKVYSWQIEKKIFNTSTELYKLGLSNTPVDWGWEKNGLGDFALRMQAEEEFIDWRNRIDALRKEDLAHILDMIVNKINSDGLSLIVFDGTSRDVRVLKPMGSESLPAKPELSKKERGPQLRTENGLLRLREIRLDAIGNHRPIPPKAMAMEEAGITDKTWKKYDQELWARWDDKSYKQEKQE